jgi:hypothetical protein
MCFLPNLEGSIEDYVVSKVIEPLPHGHYNKHNAKESERKKRMRITMKNARKSFHSLTLWENQTILLVRFFVHFYGFTYSILRKKSERLRSVSLMATEFETT